MYVLNKIIGFLISPVNVGLIGCAVCAVLSVRGKRRAARVGVWTVFAWIILWSLPLTSRIVRATLETPYLVGGRVPTVESYPPADAIELHGGAMGSATNLSDSAEMWTNADRVWHAARLWKAGKAPLIYVTGGGVKASTAGLLWDFGVPTNAVVFAEEPRNTEEEARFVAGAVGKARVLVVTSAWHMRRTLLMYEKYAPDVEAIPAPCDFEGTMDAAEPIGLEDFVPDPLALFGNTVALHEWIGYFGYKLLR